MSTHTSEKVTYVHCFLYAAKNLFACVFNHAGMCIYSACTVTVVSTVAPHEATPDIESKMNSDEQPAQLS